MGVPCLGSLEGMFETARGFLLLEWFDEGESPKHSSARESCWLHVPLLNQSSWAVALSKLVPDSDASNRRAAQISGNIALRSCSRGLEFLAADGPVFAGLGMENCPRMFTDTDLQFSCWYSVYELAEGRRDLQDLSCAFGGVSGRS